MKKNYFLKLTCYIVFIISGYTTLADNIPLARVEYEALVDFYNATNGAQWNKKWDISANTLHIESWYGITTENGHVTEINLRGNRIQGAIPASFNNLKFLKKLDLYGYYGGDLSTTDLNNLSGLENLEYLDLSYSKIKGEIPASWTKLTRLKTLILHTNEFSGIIFKEIGELKELKVLNLNHNKFTGIPESISTLLNLTTFDAQQNKIAGSLPKGFEALTKLTRLNVNYNELAHIDALLPSSVSLSLNYQNVSIGNLNYTGEDIVIPSLPKITTYDRKKNDFSYVPEFIVYLRGSNIATLKMEADGSLIIPMGYLSSLRQGDDLYLSQRSGTASGTNLRFNTISINLPKVPDTEYQALVDLYNATNGTTWNNKWPIESNTLHEGTWYGISIENGHVTEISLRGNRLRGAIPASFKNLKFLKKLDLYGYYGGDLSTTDLNNLSGLENLEYLDLSYSKIKGEIPTSWGSLTQLKTLILHTNELSGIIFKDIGDLKKLEVLNLNNNNFTEIPESISSLLNLTTFDAQQNKIAGSLPKGFEALTKLTRLNVNYNELSDIDALLPSSVSLSVNSQNLLIGDLNYTGDDVVLASLPQITTYDRKKNDFSHVPEFGLYLRGSQLITLKMATDGSLTIPKSYLSSLRQGDDLYLYQRNGTSSGTSLRFKAITIDLPVVPETEYQALVDFYNATNGSTWNTKWPIENNTLHEGTWYGVSIENGHVTEINLRGNRLRGTIPASFKDLTFLKKLDLYGYYGGDLSTTDLNNLSELVNLEHLDLSYNQISDSIPSSWAQLKKLKTLLLNNNGFTFIPESISGLQDLTTFDAQQNKIAGSLPKGFEELTKLTRLNVYYNELSDVAALLPSSVSLNLNYQNVSIGDLNYTGEDVVLSSLPKITTYDRKKNDFSYVPEFTIYLRGSNMGSLKMATDGSLTIPKSYLSSLRQGDDLYLSQRNGTASGTNLRFNTISIDLPKVPETEYQALVDFYNATNGATWNTKWPIESNTLHEGTWHGISIENGHVTEINLRGNRLRGAIPASFKNLKFLKKLDLYGYYGGDLSTTDLNHLSELVNLEHLDLSYNQITGNIPSSWKNLNSLKTLILSNNAIEDINTSLSSLKSLNSINFSYQNFKMESIEIGGNEIQIDLPLYMVMKVTDSIVSFDAKNEFHLYVNGTFKKTAFSNNGTILFTGINLLNLKESDKLRIYQVNGLAAYSNINYDKVSFGLPLADDEFNFLKTFYASTNGDEWTNKWDITENNVNKISWFGVSIKQGHVVALNLPNNNLSGSLPSNFDVLPNLKVLSLPNNKIEGSLPDQLPSLTQLEVLEVSNNQLSGAIPSKIAGLKKLKKFAIGHNLFKGTIPAVLSDFQELEYLDISNNSFDNIEKKLYYDFSRTYIDLRNQNIAYDLILSLDETTLKVDLHDIVKYDLENNNFEAKNNFSLLVNNLTHDVTTLNDLGEITFHNVRINEIPKDATIVVRQTSGSFLNTEFHFAGIEDKSNVPVVEQEYLALVAFNTALKGDRWTNKWDTTSNDLHNNKWYGVTTYDGHVVSINLNDNNLQGSLPDVFLDLPYLRQLNLSSNKISDIAVILPETIDLSIDRQDNARGTLALNFNSVIKDQSVNRYDPLQKDFINQTYYLTINDFSRTVNLPQQGLKLVDLMTKWNVPNGQKIILRQTSGLAINSIITYDLNFEMGDANLDDDINVLDIQTTINHIFGNNIKYFNQQAADINNDGTISLLDIIGQVNLIQDQNNLPENRPQKSISTSSSEHQAKIFIRHGDLVLDTGNHEVSSFEIILKDAKKTDIEEFLSAQGFSVFLKENDNQLSMIAFSVDNTLQGTIALAKLYHSNISIQSIMLSDQEANELPCEISDYMLGIEDNTSLLIQRMSNYPNPFNNETTITFYLKNYYPLVTLQIYDNNGKKLMQQPIAPISKGINTYKFKSGTLPSGVYFYGISAGNNPVHSPFGKMIIK